MIKLPFAYVDLQKYHSKKNNTDYYSVNVTLDGVLCKVPCVEDLGAHEVFKGLEVGAKLIGAFIVRPAYETRQAELVLASFVEA
jgi:hypothetical protein